MASQKRDEDTSNKTEPPSLHGKPYSEALQRLNVGANGDCIAAANHNLTDEGMPPF